MEDSVKVQKEALMKKRRFRSQAEDEEGPERKKEKKKRGVRAEMM